MCPAIGFLSQGTATPTCDDDWSTAGTICNVRCYIGFKLVGVLPAYTCKQNGEWTPRVGSIACECKFK